MFNLILDIGNTRAKGALFENEKLMLVEVEAIHKISELMQKMTKNVSTINNIVVSSVALSSEDFLCGYGKLIQDFKAAFFWFDHSLSWTFSTDYAIKSNLGSDRVALIAACELWSKDLPAMVVDLGTCITYDYFDATSKTHLGGQITPGMRSRFLSLFQHTKELPLLKPNRNLSLSFFGTTTHTNIQIGVEKSIVAEIESFYHTFAHQQNANINLFLTGGDADFFSAKTKLPHKATPHMVFYGINHLLSYNTHHELFSNTKN